MLDDYAQLPTSPPQGCFVCSTAARGHQRFVRSEWHENADGTAVRVNDQLRHLKALELFLLNISPRAHRRCRQIYDCCGP
jgi:hypothetical protein